MKMTADLACDTETNDNNSSSLNEEENNILLISQHIHKNDEIKLNERHDYKKLSFNEAYVVMKNKIDTTAGSYTDDVDVHNDANTAIHIKSIQANATIPPDGGWGWVVVAASFCCNLAVDGIIYSFGIFLPILVEKLGSSKAKVSLIGSLLSGSYLAAETHKWSTILSRRKTTELLELEGDSKLARVLGLLELTALGVGSTLGIGIYVLAGDVAVNSAGPAVIISFLIAAIASAFAGLCYAEFASRVPRAGSAYIYSYVTIGEFCAFIIGWNLILEYAIGTASVAKGLSNYLDILLDNVMQKTLTKWMPIHVSFLSSYPDFFAGGLVMLLSVLVAWGVKESSTINGIFTIINLLTIFIIIVCGAFKANTSYWFIPKEDIPPNVNGGEGRFLPFGWAGVMAGAAKCFFGFVGFDVIATTGEEAKNPKKNIPLSIVVSLLIIFIAYFGVASVITMIIPYYEQNEDAPLPYAFNKAGLPGVMWIISVGAICALLASLLTVVFPLTRILYAMAEDGVLFKFLATVNNKTKTPVVATMLSGILSAIVAGIFNLDQLIDMMSIGTLLAYSIVAFCILFLRYEKDTESLKQSPALFQDTVSVNPIFQQLKIMFNSTGVQCPNMCTEKIAKKSIYYFCTLATVLCFSFIYLENFISNENICMYFNIILTILTILSFVVLARQPRNKAMIPFKVPFIPLIPCCSILMNIYLMMKLDVSTWIRFILWLIIGFVIYAFYSINHSVEGKKMLNDEQHRKHVDE